MTKSTNEPPEPERAERSRLEGPTFAERIVETLRDPLIVLDANLRVGQANKAFYQTFLVTPEETISRFFYELGNGQWNRPELRTLLEDVLHRSNYFRDFEVEHRSPGAGAKIMLLNADRIEQEGAAAPMILLSIKDITEHRQAQKEADRADRAKDEFLATVSHELKNPLNAIFGWAQLLRSGKLAEPQVAQAIEAIDRNAKALAQLIDHVLDVSRIITGKLRLDVGVVDLPSITEAAIEAVRPAADAKGIRLEVMLDPNAGPVSGDPARLQQVIWNLLSNAMKFTPNGGRVQVRLERGDSYIELSVKDNGKGIKAELMPYVFDRFRQDEGGLTRAAGGLGLGLALVRHLVEIHGGSVEAKSEGEGKGAAFIVRVPIRA